MTVLRMKLRQLWNNGKRRQTFPIRYFKKQNGGKHTAINVGLEKAVGELFFTVDSDDYLTDDALERIAYWESTIAGKSGYAGVVGRKKCVREDESKFPRRQLLALRALGWRGSIRTLFFMKGSPLASQEKCRRFITRRFTNSIPFLFFRKKNL